jgi:hypothetical protein
VAIQAIFIEFFAGKVVDGRRLELPTSALRTTPGVDRIGLSGQT